MFRSFNSLFFCGKGSMRNVQVGGLPLGLFRIKGAFCSREVGNKLCIFTNERVGRLVPEGTFKSDSILTKLPCSSTILVFAHGRKNFLCQSKEMRG